MSITSRRYDIDWLRVIAIGLLLMYHVAIGFQPWGIMIGFITNKDPWTALWIPMAMLNIWRIHLLFLVSGMGVYFALQHRNWKQLMQERSLRILVPYIVGSVCIFPLSIRLLQHYYGWELNYAINAGHLWFLGNIFVYVVLLSPLFYYLKGNEQGKFVQALKKLWRTPMGLIPVVAVFVAEVEIMKPYPYELYAMTWHGFVLGFLAFLMGFCLVLTGDTFWTMIMPWRWTFLAIAIVLFSFRTFYFGMKNPAYLLVLESDCWIFSVLAFGHRHLNYSGRALSYLSEAAYPVYILHMIFLFLGSSLIFPMAIPVPVKFLLVLLFTFLGCFAAFEVIKRATFLRPLFGMKIRAGRATLKESTKELTKA